ncbi:MAG: hypothetical protein LUG91_05060 [Ruminococcus sp.]|nr:hypothetical protein [Ruminococcus sp.]
MKSGLRSYLYKNVRIISKRNNIYEGVVNNYIPAKDNDIEEDAIGLVTGRGFYESDIVSIEIIEDE